jgi:prolyl oligopeptidase
VTDTYFGIAVPDPYRYFEDVKSPEFTAWLKAESGYARTVLARIPGRDTVRREVEKHGDAVAARVSDVQIVGDRVYYQKRLANENLPRLYVREGFAGKERLLVNPEAITTPDGKHSSLDYYAPSPDNRHVAYGISPAGSEDAVLRVIEVATGKVLPDAIDRAQFAAPSWLPDGRLLYTRLQKTAENAPPTDRYRNARVFVHTLGDDPDRDVALFGAGVTSLAAIDPDENVVVRHVPGSAHAVALAINGVQREFRLWTAPLTALDGERTPWVRVVDTADAVTDYAIQGDALYLMTHKGASRFKVVRTSLAKPDVATAETVVPAGESVVTAIASAGDALYVRKRSGGASELFRLPRDGSVATPIRLPFAGDIEDMAADPRRPGVAFAFGGWTRFGAVYAFDPASGRVRDTGLQPQGRFDNPPHLVATEVKVKAADGTLVPLSIVHRKGLKLDGGNPTIVYGYGAYGIATTPFFRPTWLSWFDRGGVLAVAHVRGGGEYGEDWHKAGFQATKPNTWRDAIACAEWLVANKYTSPARMSVMGGSAGGVLVGRAITERPELFGAAVGHVPMSDAVRSEFAAMGPPNVPEFGSVKSEAGFRGLHAMSPYHAVKDGVKYPAVLLTAGVNDPRVDVWDPAKMAARLQAASTSGKPVLLRIDFDAGHGVGTTKKQAYEERADTFAFLLWQAGVAGFQPRGSTGGRAGRGSAGAGPDGVSTSAIRTMAKGWWLRATW